MVGGVVEPRRIEELPLNGRQFANLAATLPGVGIAFHRDPTKGTQYTPQVMGGAGRNVNYLVDGGDNNDDTVGGQLQMFPLDAIEEFRFSSRELRCRDRSVEWRRHERRHQERHEPVVRQRIRVRPRRCAQCENHD